jgi:hypothetical protein
MKRISTSELAPGMRLGEDLNFQRGGLGVPLFSRGAELTATNIIQIQRFFSQSSSILVQDNGNRAGRGAGGDAVGAAVAIDSAGSPLDPAQLAEPGKPLPTSPLTGIEFVDATADKERVDALIQSTMAKRPEFAYTKAKFGEYFAEVGGLLESFAKSGTLDQQQVAELARLVTNDFKQPAKYFDPSMLYLVQLED